jgi:recombination protein RecA
VESWFEHLALTLTELEKSKLPCLYILDSLDALSDRAELERDINKGTYAMNKQKMIGQLFRQHIKRIENTRLHLMIVSQVRENIGVSFGEKFTRSGGKAMDFYATHLLWLAQIKKLDKTIKKQKRVYGILVRAKCKKNKIGLPFREAEFPIIFGYGVDDITAMIDWLEDVNASSLNLLLESYQLGKANKSELIKQLEKAERQVVITELQKLVRNEWEEIETRFIPTMRKY